ncbi:thiol-disulfide isomerase/thioredoxin [Edaphobacter aggregans]|uniref:Thiol-disulfide isomerase/thioredoxin n=1 Tax=Edaphobacter aggregans TaxID=570835 RepID=A0A3R9P904_9BACT|nr:TlpA disulfide reductase family protein [Edaphobacter aggregans]RSL16211.1 thiol-disulfide isomerase/thioredoxin [Edaphobacter aggregans]
MKFSLFALCSVLLVGKWGQAQIAQEFSDPVVLLQEVARTYAAGADTFRMEAIEESVSENEFQHLWRKTYRTAIKGTGKLYRIETHSGSGSYIQVSDGETEWISQMEGKAYVKHPVPANWPTMPRVMSGGNFEISSAWRMRTYLEVEAARFKRAAFLPEETIQVEGHSFSCYVVRVTSSDSDLAANPELHSETTIWIDKKMLVFRKQMEQIHNYSIIGEVHIPHDELRITVYPVIDFQPKLDTALFHFSPPADSRLLASLEPHIDLPSMKPSAPMTGEQAPDVQFHAANGSSVSLKSFEGKPVLIDFWATWCGPCLLSMPSLARVYSDAKGKGLVLLSVDEDNLAESATSYLARHNYDWANYHEDGKIGKAFKNDRIPLTVLIDAKGKIVYYDFGGDEAGLRSAIAALGPEFSSTKASTAK